MDTSPLPRHLRGTDGAGRDPGLWLPLSNGDNLCSSARTSARHSGTECMEAPGPGGDAEVDRLADKLKTCCVPGWVATKGLTAMVEQAWWERTACHPPQAPQRVPRPVQPMAPRTPRPRQQRGRPSRADGFRSRCRRAGVALPDQDRTTVAAPSPPRTGPQFQPEAKRTGSVPTSKAGIPVWWQPQAPAPPPTPAKPTTSAGRIAGQLCIIVALILFLGLAARAPAAAVIIGVLPAAPLRGLNDTTRSGWHAVTGVMRGVRSGPRPWPAERPRPRPPPTGRRAQAAAGPRRSRAACPAR